MVSVEKIVILVGIVAACALVPERVGHLVFRAAVKTSTAYHHLAGHGILPDAQTAGLAAIIKAGAYKDNPMTVEGMRNHFKFEILLPLDVNAHCEPVDARGTPALWVGYTPSGSFANATELEEAARNGNWLIWLHGGGYVVGTVTMYAGLVAPMAQESGAQMLVVDYPLLPEAGSFEAVEKAALNSWRYLTETRKVDPRKIIVAGDSAGGNLAIQLALKLKSMGAAMPAGLLLDSPWVEYELTGNPFSEYEIGLTVEMMELFLKVTSQWSTEISVARLPGEKFAGLPHIRTVVGEGDDFRQSILKIHASLQSGGVNSTLDSYPKMFHGFMTAFSDYLPTGREARKKSVQWLRDTWALAAESK